MATQKLFSVTAKNQLQLIPLLMRGNQRLVLLLSLHSGCYGTHQENFNSNDVKVAQKPFQTLGHIFTKPKEPVTKEPSLFFLFRAMTVITNIIRTDQTSIWYTFERASKSGLLLRKRNFSFIRVQPKSTA